MTELTNMVATTARLGKSAIALLAAYRAGEGSLVGGTKTPAILNKGYCRTATRAK